MRPSARPPARPPSAAHRLPTTHSSDRAQGLTKVIQSAADDYSASVASEAAEYLKELAGLYEGVVGDASLRMSDTLQGIAVSVMEQASDAQIQTVARNVMADERARLEALAAKAAKAASARAAEKLIAAVGSSKGSISASSLLQAGDPGALAAAAAVVPQLPAAPKMAADLLPLETALAALSAGGAAARRALRAEVVRLLRSDYASLQADFAAEGRQSGAVQRIIISSVPGLDRFVALLSGGSKSKGAAHDTHGFVERLEELGIAESTATYATATDLLRSVGGGAPLEGSLSVEHERAQEVAEQGSEIIRGSVEISSHVLDSTTEGVNIASTARDASEALSGGWDVGSQVFSAAALASSVAHLVGDSIGLVQAVERHRNARFLSARQTGLAYEAAAQLKDQSLFTACAQFRSLHAVLARTLGGDLDAAARSNLHALLDVGKLHLTADQKAYFSQLIQARMCALLSPIHARLNALFRAGGRCAAQARNLGAPEVADASPPLAADAVIEPNIRSCSDEDVYDVVLTDRDSVGVWHAEGYTDSWVRDPWHRDLIHGELNHKIDGLGQNRVADSDAKNSRVLMVLRCKQLREKLMSADSSAAAAAQRKRLSRFSRPVSDLTLVLRDLNQKGIGDAEKAAMAAGYQRLVYRADPAVFPGEQPPQAGQQQLKMPAVKIGRWQKLKRSARSLFFGGIWDGERYFEEHMTDAADIHPGRSSDTRAAYVFIRRGGPSVLSGVLLLPFHAPINDDAMDATAESFLTYHEDVVADFEHYNNRVSTLGSTAAGALLAPPGCNVYDVAQKKTVALSVTGIRSFFSNGFAGRGWAQYQDDDAPLQQRDARIVHKFYTNCVDPRNSNRAGERVAPLKPYERWHRLPVSPYERVEAGKLLPQAAYLWVKRRYIVQPLPSGEDFLTCPSECGIKAPAPRRDAPPPPPLSRGDSEDGTVSRID